MISQRGQYILSLLLFQLFLSCKNPEAAEEIKNELIGTWKLTYSSHISDSSFVNATWIEFKEGGEFTCTNSVFWEYNAMKNQSIKGVFKVEDYYLPSPAENASGKSWNYLSLTVGNKTKTWYLVVESQRISWRISDTSEVEYHWMNGN